MTLLEAALYYASLGRPVFPLAAGTKVPLSGSNGLTDATTDEDQIRRWWAEEPSANVGVRCDHLAVVDPDVRDGKNGPDEWRGVLTEHGHEPDDSLDAPIVDTPSGGTHRWFALPAGFEAKARNDWRPGLDIKAGAGAYVVAPHSRTRKGKGTCAGEYRVAFGSLDDLPPAPEWLLDAVRKDHAKPRGEGAAPLPINSHPERTPQEALDLVRHCLDRLGADYYDPRDRWVEVGAAVHDATNASEDGYAAWENWSKQSTKFDAADTRRVWESFTVGGGLTIATLIHWAGLGAPDTPPDSTCATDRVPGPAGIDVEIIHVAKTRRTTKLLLRVTRFGGDCGEAPCSMSGHGLNECAKTICGLAEIDERDNWKRVRAWLAQRRLRTDSVAAAQRRLAAGSAATRFDTVAARALLDAYGVRFQTPVGAWWLERDGRAHEEWPQHLLGSCPGQVLDALVAAGLAGDREEAHSLYKNKKDLIAYCAREMVPDELGDTGLDRHSIRALSFRETLMRRLLAPSEFWPRNFSPRHGERCGPAHNGSLFASSLEGDAVDLQSGNALPDREAKIRARLGAWHRLDVVCPFWFRVDLDPGPGASTVPVTRFAIHFSILDPRFSVAGRDASALRRLAARYGIAEPKPLDNRADLAGKRKAGRKEHRVRVLALSIEFTDELRARAAASDPGSTVPADLHADDSEVEEAGA